MVAWVDGQGHRHKLVITMSFSFQNITTALLRKGQNRFVKLNDLWMTYFLRALFLTLEKLFKDLIIHLSSPFLDQRRAALPCHRRLSSVFVLSKVQSDCPRGIAPSENRTAVRKIAGFPAALSIPSVLLPYSLLSLPWGYGFVHGVELDRNKVIFRGNDGFVAAIWQCAAANMAFCLFSHPEIA